MSMDVSLQEVLHDIDRKRHKKKPFDERYLTIFRIPLNTEQEHDDIIEESAIDGAARVELIKAMREQFEKDIQWMNRELHQGFIKKRSAMKIAKPEGEKDSREVFLNKDCDLFKEWMKSDTRRFDFSQIHDQLMEHLNTLPEIDVEHIQLDERKECFGENWDAKSFEEFCRRIVTKSGNIKPGLSLSCFYELKAITIPSTECPSETFETTPPDPLPFLDTETRPATDVYLGRDLQQSSHLNKWMELDEIFNSVSPMDEDLSIVDSALMMTTENNEKKRLDNNSVVNLVDMEVQKEGELVIVDSEIGELGLDMDTVIIEEMDSDANGNCSQPATKRKRKKAPKSTLTRLLKNVKKPKKTTNSDTSLHPKTIASKAKNKNPASALTKKQRDETKQHSAATSRPAAVKAPHARKENCERGHLIPIEHSCSLTHMQSQPRISSIPAKSSDSSTMLDQLQPDRMPCFQNKQPPKTANSISLEVNGNRSTDSTLTANCLPLVSAWDILNGSLAHSSTTTTAVIPSTTNRAQQQGNSSSMIDTFKSKSTMPNLSIDSWQCGAQLLDKSVETEMVIVDFTDVTNNSAMATDRREIRCCDLSAQTKENDSHALRDPQLNTDQRLTSARNNATRVLLSDMDENSHQRSNHISTEKPVETRLQLGPRNNAKETRITNTQQTALDIDAHISDGQVVSHEHKVNSHDVNSQEIRFHQNFSDDESVLKDIDCEVIIEEADHTLTNTFTAVEIDSSRKYLSPIANTVSKPRSSKFNKSGSETSLECNETRSSRLKRTDPFSKGLVQNSMTKRRKSVNPSDINSLTEAVTKRMMELYSNGRLQITLSDFKLAMDHSAACVQSISIKRAFHAVLLSTHEINIRRQSQCPVTVHLIQNGKSQEIVLKLKCI